MGLCQLERARGRGCFQHLKAKLIEHIRRDHRDEKLVLNQQSAASFCPHTRPPKQTLPPYRRRKPHPCSPFRQEENPKKPGTKTCLGHCIGNPATPPLPCGRI